MIHYIDCPYEEKEEAKALGAKWDPEERRWFYTDLDDPTKFERWITNSRANEVDLLDVIKTHSSVCWYPSAGSDFRAMFFLSANYVEKQSDTLPDLFILTDYHAGEYRNYGDSDAVCLTDNFKKLESGRLKAGDFLFRDHVTEVKIKTIRPVRKLDIGIEKSMISSDIATKYASGYLMRVEMKTRKDGSLKKITIETDTVYLYAENTAFARDFLIKNKISVNWVLRIRYGSAFGGSTAKGTWLDRLAEPLDMKYLVASIKPAEPVSSSPADVRALHIMEKAMGKALKMPIETPIHVMDWYKNEPVCWYSINGSRSLFSAPLPKAAQKQAAPASKPSPAPAEPEDTDEEDIDWVMDDPYDDSDLSLPALVHNTNLLKKRLMGTIIGQDAAVQQFCDTLFDAQVLLRKDEVRKKPIAVFTFAGPPGVGKTLLAKTAAEYMQKPCCIFNMSSYSDRDGIYTLTGFDFTYKNSAPGELTKFVYENPDCVLIFDEIEKASSEVLRLFLQILDGGELIDKYYNGLISYKPDSEGAAPLAPDIAKLRENLLKVGHARVSFKQTIIIFTTNAGRPLYERSNTEKLSALPEKSILDAIRSDRDPLTGRMLFPTELVSRISSGKVMMFDHLSPKYLLQIADQNFDTLKAAFQKKYGIKLDKDKDNRFLTALLFSLGGRPDARAIASRSESFIKEKIRDVVMAAEKNEIRSIQFSVESSVNPAVERLFCSPEKANVLVYASRDVIEQITSKYGSSFTFFCADHVEEAIVLAVKNTVDLALIDMEHNSLLSGTDQSKTILATVGARKLREGVRLFKELQEKFPDLPVYTLQTKASSNFNEQLLRQFITQGARGRLSLMNEAFMEQLAAICSETYMQSSASTLSIRNKQLSFDSAVLYDQKYGIHIVELRNLTLNNAPSAEDMNSLVKAAERPSDRFDDIIGNKLAQKELRHLCEYLKNPVQFTAKGYPRPSGVLLYGPPGTGKTMLARATAGESDVAFLPTQGSILLEQGVNGVRELFAKARRNAPAIIFIDEIDSIGVQRTGNGGLREIVLNTLLAEMDGFSVDNKRPVVVIAATNADIDPNMGITMLDEALARRFSKTIRIDFLGLKEREQLIQRLAGRYIPEQTDIKQFAEMTDGLSSALIKKIVNDALQTSIAENQPFDFDTALQNVLFGQPDEEHQPTRSELRGVAMHEAGHCIVYLSLGYVPSYVTIQSRGGFGGYMSHCIEELNKTNRNRHDYLGQIRCALGGRAAEEIMYRKKELVTSGASSDLANATRIAARMVLLYGFDDTYGLVNFGQQTSPSSVAPLIRPILNEQYEMAVKTLVHYRPQLIRLTKALLEHKCLFRSQIEALLPEMIDGNDEDTSE